MAAEANSVYRDISYRRRYEGLRGGDDKCREVIEGRQVLQGYAVILWLPDYIGYSRGDLKA